MKKSIFILFLTLCVFLFSFSALADSQLVTENDVLDNYPDIPSSISYNGNSYLVKHFCILEGNGMTVVYCFAKPDFSSYFTSDNSIFLEGSDTTPVARFDLNGSSWNLYNVSSGGYSIQINGMKYYSFDIYSNSDKSEKVFQGAPLVSMVGLTPNQLLRVTMREIVGLIPLVIGLMVSWVALRKGYQWLLTRLRQA